jgi:hypothetical protein
MIAGLVTPATDVSDPSLVAPLRELEAQITHRADWLAAKATTERPSWYLRLEQSSPEAIILVREIAAYRERYGVHSPAPLGAAPARSEVGQRYTYESLLSRVRSSHVPRDEGDHESALPTYGADR